MSDIREQPISAFHFYAECIECGLRQRVSLCQELPGIRELQTSRLPMCYCTWRNRASGVRLVLVAPQDDAEWAQGG